MGLDELEKKSEARYEEQQDKRMRLFLEAEEVRRKACAQEEEKRRREERQHEEKMHYMFLSFMQQITSGHMNQPMLPQQFQFPYSHHPYTPYSEPEEQ